MMSLSIAVLFLGCSQQPEVQPFEGPEGVVGLETDAEEVLWIVTHLRVRNAPGPGGRFGELATAVGNDLYETPRQGWLGASFRNVGRLDWWTMTAWESEEDMLAWIGSEHHATAMREFTDVASAGENVWIRKPASAGVLGWDEALEALEEPDYAYTR